MEGAEAFMASETACVKIKTQNHHHHHHHHHRPVLRGKALAKRICGVTKGMTGHLWAGPRSRECRPLPRSRHLGLVGMYPAAMRCIFRATE
jgi:hypothetical protein